MKFLFPLFLTLCMSAVFFSCQQSVYPEFETIKNIHIKKLNTKSILVEAEAVIKNPNPVGTKLKASDIVVLIEGKHKANVKQIKAADIPANSSFNVPLEFSFSPKQIFQDDLLGSALSILGNKQVNAQFSGTMTVNVGGVDIPLTVDYEQDFPLKKKE